MSGKRGATQDEMLNRRVGHRIFKERQRRGLTTLVLAERADVHVNTLHRAEKGLGIGVSTLGRIGRALDIDLAEFFANPQYLVGCENADAAKVKNPASVMNGTGSLF